MTTEELNDYLISIGGLKSGLNLGRPPIVNRNYFACDSGWNSLIKELIEDLITLGWNKEVCQVKEKFGGLRFYINEGSDEIYNRITEAENKSYTICERCGNEGSLRNDIGWYTTLCEDHYQEVITKRNKPTNN